MDQPVGVRYEGLRELAQALKEVDFELLTELKGALGKVGDVVRDDARRRFDVIDQKTAAGFETRVRAGGRAQAIVVVSQRLLKTTGRRPDYGGLMMTAALLPARDAEQQQALAICEAAVGGLLHRHGF